MPKYTIDWYPNFWTPLEKERLFLFWRERYSLYERRLSYYCDSQGGIGFFDSVLEYQKLDSSLSEQEKQVKLINAFNTRKDNLLKEFYLVESQIEDKKRLALLLFAEEKGFEFWQTQLLFNFNKDDIPEFIKIGRESIELNERLYKAALSALIEYDRENLSLLTAPNEEIHGSSFRERVLWFSRKGRKLEYQKLINEELESNFELKKRILSKYLMISQLSELDSDIGFYNGRVSVDLNEKAGLELFFKEPIEKQLKEILGFEQANFAKRSYVPDILLSAESKNGEKLKFQRFRLISFYPQKLIDQHLKKRKNDEANNKQRLKTGYNLVNGLVERGVLTLKEPKITTLHDKIEYFNKGKNHDHLKVDPNSHYYAVHKDILEVLENDPTYLSKVLDENNELIQNVKRLIERRRNNAKILETQDLDKISYINLTKGVVEDITRGKEIDVKAELNKVDKLERMRSKLIHSRDFNKRRISEQQPINMTMSELDELKENQEFLRNSVLINEEELDTLSTYLQTYHLNTPKDLDDSDSESGDGDIKIMFEEDNGVLFERDAHIKKYTKKIKRKKGFFNFKGNLFDSIKQGISEFKQLAENVFEVKQKPALGLESKQHKTINKVTTFEFKNVVKSVKSLFELKKEQKLQHNAPTPFKR